MIKVIEWLDDITWWKRKPRIWYRNIKYFISNLIYYTPMLWKDRNWSEHYIFKILLYKLKRQEKITRSHGHLMISEQIADEMKFCINLIETRILEDDYLELSGYNKLDDKWGELKLYSKDEDFPGLLHCRREYVKTEEDKIKAQKDANKAMDNMEYLIKQDINYLFDYMKKHIRNWWD